MKSKNIGFSVGGGLAGSTVGNKIFKAPCNIIDNAGRVGANAVAYVGAEKLSDNLSEITDTVSNAWDKTIDYFGNLFNNEEEEEDEEEKKKRLLGLR